MPGRLARPKPEFSVPVVAESATGRTENSICATLGTVAPVRDDVQRWARGLVGAPADVLASVAMRLLVAWDGPGAPTVDVGSLPDAPPWELLDVAREAVVAPDRRRLGAHHTPPPVARRLVEIALEGITAGATVLDPACGGGTFLVAAAQHRPDVRLRGIDLDPLAVATTRAALRSVGVVEARIDRGDGLAAPWAADVVIGNPPFLSPLGADTAGTPAAVAMRAELGAPYADVAALFLLVALERVTPGGRVVLLQPESMLSSRDTKVVRAATVDALEGLWAPGEPVFDAAVRVCAPVLRVGGADGRISRWKGRSVEPTGSAPRPTGSTWASLRPTSAPRVRVAADQPRLGDIASATAGFRDEFYGVAAAVTDGGLGAPVVTSGLVDPGEVSWGRRPARIGGRMYRCPVVDPDRLEPRVSTWVTARLVPKVLVATQTKVVEAGADPDGRFVPLTPVLAVTPHDPAEVWRVAAALTSPVVTAWAVREFGGTALAADAVKLSASAVLGAPLPVDAAAWAVATTCLRAGDVRGCGEALAGGDGALLAWWLGRLPTRTV
jgi:SAM-dependent methyltransferase